MAEEWRLAFGRYLRTLRKRRGLTLDEVASLSQSFPNTVTKSYLSRCENGRQSLAFSKVAPLSRIYKVPSDVLLERVQLDQELERIGGPETEGLRYAELRAAGVEALDAGRRWDAYGYLRDAVARVPSAPLRPRYRNAREFYASALLTCGTAAKSLGRYQFARHEFLFLLRTDALGPVDFALLLDRLATVHRCLGDFSSSRSYGDRAVAAAEAAEGHEFLGSIYTNRGLLAYDDKDPELAVSLYKKAYRVFRDTNRPAKCALVLNNLAQVHFDAGRFGTARRALEASLRITKRVVAYRSRALARILLGEIDDLQGRQKHAIRHWRKAAATARRVNDQVLSFKAEYLLMKQAHQTGNQAVKRSIERRLRRLANYIPDRTAELQEFEEYLASNVEAC